MYSLRTLRYIAVLAFACSVAVMAGCGPAKTEVSGTIKINGKAPNVKGLEIVFLGADGNLAAATINADGAYTASNVAIGEAKISFAFLPNKHFVTDGDYTYGVTTMSPNWVVANCPDWKLVATDRGEDHLQYMLLLQPK